MAEQPPAKIASGTLQADGVLLRWTIDVAAVITFTPATTLDQEALEDATMAVEHILDQQVASGATASANLQTGCIEADVILDAITAAEVVRKLAELEGESSRARPRIPADVVVLLRGALYTELARACDDAPAVMPEAHTRAGWTDVLEQIEGARAALEAIGWDAPTRQRDVGVELDQAMIEALEASADSWGWLSEQVTSETAHGRRQAGAKATTIKRFLASVKPSDAKAKGGDA